ncbi:hypothetical protein QYE76_070123 [Lolium multiflorum]|uniref:Uncharacterized protein n=1 Tax=Lolium multiflorum TaxID=4521 RepID=A0AAD8SJA1_LOLMU|nr:hypothetical protein QYE76_070123 [Lolium multiflorum]
MTRLTLEPYKYPRRIPSNLSFFLCSNSSSTENSSFRPPPVAAVWGIPKHRRGHPHLHHPQHAPPARGIEPRRSQSPDRRISPGRPSPESATLSSSPAITAIADHLEQPSASTERRIIEVGYSPRDPKNLTRRDVVDDQLNATAINMIHMAITPKDRAHIRSLKTAKEAWDKLEKLFLGNASIQSSRFDEVNNMADNFVMIEGETPEEMYRRLIALAVQMQDLGATFVDDHWIKRKFYNALLPYEEVKLMAIRQNALLVTIKHTTPLGTPRGRCDAISRSFPRKETKVIEPVGVKKHVEG